MNFHTRSLRFNLSQGNINKKRNLSEGNKENSNDFNDDDYLNEPLKDIDLENDEKIKSEAKELIEKTRKMMEKLNINKLPMTEKKIKNNVKKIKNNFESFNNDEFMVKKKLFEFFEFKYNF